MVTPVYSQTVSPLMWLAHHMWRTKHSTQALLSCIISLIEDSKDTDGMIIGSIGFSQQCPGFFSGGRSCIPKNTEAEYIPDILHVLGSSSLLQIVKV